MSSEDIRLTHYEQQYAHGLPLDWAVDEATAVDSQPPRNGGLAIEGIMFDNQDAPLPSATVHLYDVERGRATILVSLLG